MFGTIPPFYSLGGGGGFGITGSPSAGWVFNKTAETGAAEVVATFGVSDALISSGNYLRIANRLSTDSRFAPEIIGSCGNSNLTALHLTAQGTTDSSGSLMAFNARIGTSTTVVTRPLYSFLNNGTEILSLLPLNSGANSALNWGLQTGGAPTFTTRSAGTRIILANTLDASNVDYAIGQAPFTTWYSVAQATSSFNHKWYGGTTQIAELRGDGRFAIGAAVTGAETLRVFATTNAAITVGVGSTNAIRFGVDASNIGYTGSANATVFQVRTNGLSRVAFDTAGAAATFSVPVGVPSYTVATLPVATTAGRIVYVSDAAVAPCLAFANGTNWKRCDNAATTVV